MSFFLSKFAENLPLFPGYREILYKFVVLQYKIILPSSLNRFAIIIEWIHCTVVIIIVVGVVHIVVVGPHRIKERLEKIYAFWHWTEKSINNNQCHCNGQDVKTFISGKERIFCGTRNKTRPLKDLNSNIVLSLKHI